MTSRNAVKTTVGAAALIAAWTAASCTLETKFWEFDDKAPLRSISPPSAYVGDDFGSVLAPLSIHAVTGGGMEELDGDYLAVAGRPASEVVVLRFSKEDKILGGSTYYRYPLDFSEGFPDTEFAASMAPVPVWEYASETREGCFVVGAPGAGRIELIDLLGFHVSRGISLVDSAGTSIDSVIRTLDRPVEGFVVGGTDGAVFVPADLSSEGRLLEGAGTVPAPADVRTVTSGSRGPGGMPYLAVGSDGLVYVYLFDTASSAYVLHECIEDPAEGFGTLVTGEDADGDGIEDLLLSNRTGIEGGFDEVVIVDGRRYDTGPGLPPDGCITTADLDSASHVLDRIGCRDHEAHGVACGPAPLFGASMAVGDLDTDAVPEIIVGAPGAVVEGENEAGTALIFHVGDPEPLSSLRRAHPGEDQRLGSSLAVLEIAGRDEVLVGVPESEDVLLFYCSGIGEDASPTSGKCR